MRRGRERTVEKSGKTDQSRRKTDKVPSSRGTGPSSSIAIWGSCVSRDTCEFIPDSVVGAYVARQSAIVSLGPYTGPAALIQRLDSAFQQRMISGDVAADAVQRITKAQPGIILVDLVDERHGVWAFPDGSYLTNSVEASRAGVERWAPAQGARLIEFGTDEHFALWHRGFRQSICQLRELTTVPIVLLDIAWAEVFDGQALPRGIRSFLGARGRELQRGYRSWARSLVRGEPLTDAFGKLFKPGSTRAEELLEVSQRANARYHRYVVTAEELVTATIHRSVEDVRMDPDHRWGVGPYHYRDDDYREIARGISNEL